jgi:hypothetical protein
VQITDFNPGVRQNGLFWTVVLTADAVDVDLAAGTATLRARNLPVKDFHDFENAILGDGAPPTPGMVSFTVQWTASGPSTHVDNPAQMYRADIREAAAQMDFTAVSGDFEYVSAALETSTTDAAQLGFQSNGSFY